MDFFKKQKPLKKDKVEEKEINMEEVEEAEEEDLNKIVETFIFGKLEDESPYYNNFDSNKTELGVFDKGELLQIEKYQGKDWCFVRSKDEKEGWVPRNNIIIQEVFGRNEEEISEDVIEKFINHKSLESDTNKLVWVNINRQTTYIFSGEKGDWKLEKSMLSATGKNSTPTFKGTYKIQDRGEWFFTERFGSGAKYWVRYDGTYLFHSVAMDEDQNITDHTLGSRASEGCIRLSVENSKWFFGNIKEGTTVFIN